MIVLFMRNWIRIPAVVRVMRTLHVQGAQLAGPRMVKDHRVTLSILNMQIRKRTFTHTFNQFEFVEMSRIGYYSKFTVYYVNEDNNETDSLLKEILIFVLKFTVFTM